jgi:hypothetical protein
MTSSEAAAIAVAAGGRAGIWNRPEPRAMRRVLPARLRDPHRVEPELVAELGELDLLVEREPRPVGEEESDAHTVERIAG